MESLSRTLQPYKEVIGTLASYVTIAQFFSGAFICNDIRKKGNTSNISALPFVGGIVISFTMLKYGLLLNEEAMLRVNVAAITLNILYTVYYLFYSNDKWNEVLKPLSIGMPLVAVLWGYAEWENPNVIEYRYGLIVTILMLCLIGTPLLDLKTIITTKDASKIPFVLTLMGTLVTFLWLLYAIVLLNQFMLVQNVIGFTLCFVQLILIFLYPGGIGESQGKTKKGVKKD